MRCLTFKIIKYRYSRKFLTYYDNQTYLMKLKNLLFLFTISLSTASYGQDSLVNAFQQRIVSPYENYFKQERERIYLHLNRSEYLAGDNIWFKAYAYEAKAKLPMVSTNKVYAELFDQNGKLLERKILFVSNGVTNNYFKLSDKLKTGIYTIRAYTNWMRNFNDIYSQEFKVVSFESPAAVKTSNASIVEEADLQVFPEGGRFVRGVNNHFGVKLTLPNGKGTRAEGYVIGAGNDTLQQFTTNQFGIGDFIINAAQKIKYRVAVKYDGGKIKETTIAEPAENGVGLMVNTLSPTRVIVSINTNAKTVEMLQGNNILILVHNNGLVIKSSYIKVSEKGFVSIDKSLLDAGVNYITIFGPGFQPLAERLIFNNLTTVRGNVDVSHTLLNDSLQVNLLTSGLAGTPANASLSISILPENTTGNSFNNSLLTEMLLNAVKGEVENPSYYIENNDLQHQKDVDNLLLTQGWRGYKWPEILSGKLPDLKYPFENGFTINTLSKNLFKGKAEKNSKLSLFSPQNSLILSSDVDDEGKANFEELYLRDSTHVVISSSNLKGSGSNRNLIASIKQPMLDSTIASPRGNIDAVNETKLSRPLLPKPIELNEVVITSQKVVNPFANSIYSTAADPFFVITKDNYNQYPSIESLLQRKFFLRVTRGQFGELSIDMGRGQRSLLGSNSPALILDGSVMQDLSLLSMIQIDDIEAIAVNKNGTGLSNGGNGSINIITRKSPLDLGDDGYKNTRTILVKGFENPVSFYTPRYILSPESETYQRFASIYWNADIETDASGSARIQVAIPRELSQFMMRIEGIAPDGAVYYMNKKIDTRPRP